MDSENKAYFQIILNTFHKNISFVSVKETSPQDISFTHTKYGKSCISSYTGIVCKA